MWKKCVICAVIWMCLMTTRANQIFFPQDNSMYNASAVLEQSRNTNAYEPTVAGIISRGVLKLTLSLQKYMASQSQADNVVFAPVNIGGALALVLLASSGRTFDEIASLLGLASGVDIHANSERVHVQIGRTLDKLDRSTSFDAGGEELKLATAVFVESTYPIRRVFQAASEQIYRSEVLGVDFAHGERAKHAINAWVNDRTHGKIQRMLDESPPETTKVVIASALYFKAAWEKPFFEGFTKKRPFYVNGRDQPADMHVDMMTNGGLFPYFRDRTLDCEIMGFPYKENKSTLYVIMPNKANKERLLDLQNRLTASELDRLADSTRYTQSVIGFPKMTLDSSLDLSAALMEFGAKSLFNPREANLALLSPGPAGAAFQYSQNYQGEQQLSSLVRNPIEVDPAASGINGEFLIFSRSGVPINCTEIFDRASNITKCQEIDAATQREVVYKKFGDKVGRRISRDTQQQQRESIDKVRQVLGAHENPGLYADKVLHKVFMEITESGTEAAAATSVSLTRGGDITTFRVDQPFIFFIRNHETRLVLFWGSVTRPTPNYTS